MFCFDLVGWLLARMVGFDCDGFGDCGFVCLVLGLLVLVLFVCWFMLWVGVLVLGWGFPLDLDCL